ncbi:hypothetical protein EMIT0P12_20287 [Pseudomonas sp. IT-P12]
MGYMHVGPSCRPSLTRLSEMAGYVAGKCIVSMGSETPAVAFLAAQWPMNDGLMLLLFLKPSDLSCSRPV